MKKVVLLATAIAGTLALGVYQGSEPAFAETKRSEDIVFAKEMPKRYDSKIEAAAISRAAKKIGDLRGSILGGSLDDLMTKDALRSNQSSSLGFPIFSEPSQNTDSVPLV